MGKEGERSGSEKVVAHGERLKLNFGRRVVNVQEHAAAHAKPDRPVAAAKKIPPRPGIVPCDEPPDRDAVLNPKQKRHP